MRFAALSLSLILLAGCGRAEVAVVPCASLTAGCAVMLNGQALQVRTDASPAPLQSFEVSVQVARAREVALEFNMQGMEMGPNRYRLSQHDGYWRGRVTLPACVSGRRDWRMIVEVDGRRVALPFQTN